MSPITQVQYQQQQQLQQWSSPEADDRFDDYDDDDAVDSEYHLPSEEESYRYIDMQSQLQNRAFLERRQLQTGPLHPRQQPSLSDLLWGGEDESSVRSSPSEKYAGDPIYQRAMDISSSSTRRYTYHSIYIHEMNSLLFILLIKRIHSGGQLVVGNLCNLVHCP